MNNKMTLATLLLAFTSFNSFAVPPNTQTKSYINNDANKQVASLNRSIKTVRDALYRYYGNEKSWPSSLSVLESKGYLPKNYTAFIGQMNYADTNNALVLTIDLPEGNEGRQVAARTAALTGAKAAASRVTLQITPKVGFIDPNNYIDRLNPKALATDINLNNHWIKNGSLQGSTIDVTSAGSTDLTVSRDASVTRNVKVEGLLHGKDASLASGRYLSGVTASTVTVEGNTALSGKTTTQDSKLNGASSIQEAATLKGPVVANGQVRLNADLQAHGNVTFNHLAQLQDATFNGAIRAIGGITGTQATFQQGLIDQVRTKDLAATDVTTSGQVTAKNIQAKNIYAVNGEFSGNLTTQGLVTKASVQANNGLYVGANNILVADKDGNLYQAGKQLNQVFLGKDGKAVDTDKLDGLTADEIAQLRSTNIHTARNTFNGLLRFDGVGYAGGQKWIDPLTGKLSEGAATLDTRYLGINAKAADTDLLDGLTASQLGQLARENQFTSRATFQRALHTNSNLMLNNATVASNGNWFEGGQALSLRYLRINGKAVNSALLDGLQAGQIAQKGPANTFTGSNTFSQDVSIAGQGLLGSVRAAESRTTSLEGRVVSTNSQLDNLLYIKSRCRVHAKDPGCKFIFTPKVPAEVPTHTWGLFTATYNSGQSTIHQRSGWANAILNGSISPAVSNDVKGLEIIWQIGPPIGRVCVRSEKISWPGGSSCKGRPLNSLKLLSTGQTFDFSSTTENTYCSYCSTAQSIPINIISNGTVYEPIILK